LTAGNSTVIPLLCYPVAYLINSLLYTKPTSESKDCLKKCATVQEIHTRFKTDIQGCW